MQSDLPVDLLTDPVATTEGSLSDPGILFQAFRIGTLWCYAGFDEATELVEPLMAAWLPNTPAWFKGLAHLNGYVVPVIDLAQADTDPAQHDQAPMFHLLFGRQQQRIAVGIHSLPFTVTAPNRAMPVTHQLPGLFAYTVEAVLRWSDIRYSATASSLGVQPPQHLHHLSLVLLENWFSQALHGNLPKTI